MPRNTQNLYLAWLIGWKDCMVRFQHRPTLVFVIVLPLAMTVVSGLAFQGLEPDKRIEARIALVDDHHEPIAARFRAALEDRAGASADNSQQTKAGPEPTGGARLTLFFNIDSAEAARKIRDKELDGAIVLPQGLSRDLEANKTGKIELLVGSNRTVERSVVESIADWVVERVRRLQQGDRAGIQVDRREQRMGTAPFNSFSQAVAGNGVMFILMNCITTGGMAIVREKRQNTLARLLISPMPPGMIVLGKTLGVFMVGVVQALVVFGFGAAIGVHLGSVVGITLVTLVFILVGCAIGLLISALADREDVVEAIGAPASLVITALGGGMFPVELGPAWMKTVSFLLPTGWAMAAYHKLMWEGQAWTSVLPHLAVLALFAAVFLALGVRYLRWE